MNNHQKLQELLEDILLLDDGQYALTLHRDEVETWDSMATVAIAVGIEEVFHHHPLEEEAVGLESVAHIIAFLEGKGVRFD